MACCNWLLPEAGARLINPDRMWHYTEGVHNWNPIWPAARHPHPSRTEQSVAGSDAAGGSYPNIPGADTLRHASAHHDERLRAHWFVLNRAIIKREFALSGSEQNPDLTGRASGSR